MIIYQWTRHLSSLWNSILIVGTFIIEDSCSIRSLVVTNFLLELLRGVGGVLEAGDGDLDLGPDLVATHVRPVQHHDGLVVLHAVHQVGHDVRQVVILTNRSWLVHVNNTPNIGHHIRCEYSLQV